MVSKAKDLLGTVPIERIKEIRLSGSIHKNVRLVSGLAQSLHRLGGLPVEFAGFVVNLQLKIRITLLAELVRSNRNPDTFRCVTGKIKVSQSGLGLVRYQERLGSDQRRINRLLHVAITAASRPSFEAGYGGKLNGFLSFFQGGGRQATMHAEPCGLFV